MLISEKTETTWNPTTREWYEKLGYKLTQYRSKFTVNVKDLPKSSNVYVEFECDYCHENSKTQYKNYIRNNNNFENKDMCITCIKKYKAKANRENKTLTVSDVGFYEKKENRLSIVKEYIEKYGSLDGITKIPEGYRIYANLHSYNESIYDIAIELGYELEDICKRLPVQYNSDIAKIVERINEFIETNNRFPKRREMEKDCRINGVFLNEIGGVSYFKTLMNYSDKKDYIDNRGDYNKSLGEMITANFLISQGLQDKYKREQHPFPKKERKFCSDFTFYLDDKEIHIEVWGYKKNDDNTKQARKYQARRKIKEETYAKYSDKIILINIEYEIFYKKYEEIQEYLYNILEPYLALPYKTVGYQKLISAFVLSDMEIFEEIMKLSKDNIAPSSEELRNYNSSLYKNILKRGYKYQDFIYMFGGKLNFNPIYWNKHMIFEQFDKITDAGKIINTKSMSKSLRNYTQLNGGYAKFKLEYFDYKNNIPANEQEWVSLLASNKPSVTIKYTDNEVQLANQLLNNQHNKTNN